jgi:hypothetical protein
MRVLFAILLALSLSGCAGEDRASMLGISRNDPDEFAILKRDPLAVPNDVETPEHLPAPGSLAIATPSSQSRGASVVTGTPLPQTPTSSSVVITEGGAQAFLDKAIGTTPVDPMIRQHLKEDELKSKDILQNPLHLAQSNTVIAPKEEYARLKALKEAGKPLSDGDPVAYQEQNPLLNGILP